MCLSPHRSLGARASEEWVMGNVFGEPFRMAGGWSVDGVLRKSSSLLVGMIFFCVGLPFLIIGVYCLRLEYLFAENGVTVEGIADLKFDRPQGSRGTDSSGRGAGIHRLQEGRSIKTSMKWKKQESAPPKG